MTVTSTLTDVQPPTGHRHPAGHPDPADWLTAAQAADTFAVAPATIRSWCHRYDVPKLGGRHHQATLYHAPTLATVEHTTRPRSGRATT